jgi:hypothetical protein
VVLIFVSQVFLPKVVVVLKIGWCLKSEEYGTLSIKSFVHFENAENGGKFGGIRPVYDGI